MKMLNTNCKFCSKPIWMECDENGLVVFNPELWLPKVACNRCAEYRVKLRRTEGAIYSLCQLLRALRQNMSGQSLLEAEAKAREKLDTLTKRISTLVCDYFRVVNQWERDFTDNIFDNPLKASIVIGVYIRGIISISEPDNL